LVRGIAYSYESSAGSRHITLNVASGEEEIELYCDREMMDKILGNLLSNAFKFTPVGGSVDVTIVSRSGPPHAGDGGSGWLEITVTDTGTGIPAEQLGRIFDRFFQVEPTESHRHEGSGIGLALVKELVELHHGTIAVKSEVGRGTEFLMRFPLGRSHLRDEEIAETPADAHSAETGGPIGIAHAPPEETPGAAAPAVAGDERSIILLVEDNADVRAYVREYLAPSYRVLEAGDGLAGIAVARESVPDLIISDVMMPEKDGYQLCETLKLDERTSHIPIILLTAKAASQDRIEGLKTGADDYLIKPFEPNELQARVSNLIAQRQKLRERFSAGKVLRPGEISVTSIDDAFLQKVKGVVERHIGEEGFGVEELSDEIGMSRSQIHRKITALTDMSAGDFIRYLRLHRAKDLLRQNAATVAEISYMVGFNTPAYFTKCFHDLFGVTPSEVRRPER
jgi:CheY-like chemotaxis protein